MKLSTLLGRGLLLGGLALALALPTAAHAEEPQPPPPAIDSNGVVTFTNVWGTQSQGYYDQNGCLQYGWKPYVLGWYDANGDWHYYPNTVAIPGYFDPHGTHYDGTPPVQTYNEVWRYDFNKYNYYAGYGSRAELACGRTRIIGCDGQPHWVDLKQNRTYVHLEHDNRAQMYIVNQFDPTVLDIPTGRTVTFCTNDGEYALTPTYGDGPFFTEKVTITPNRVFSWTFTNPGTYNIQNASGGGPSDCHYPGLIIHVTGNAVPFDDTAFRCCKYWDWRTLPWTYTNTQFTPTTIPTTPATPPPPRPHPPKKHKRVLRNRDVK